MVNCIVMYEGGPAEIQTPTQRNQTGPSSTTPPPALSPNIILLPSHLTVPSLPQGKIWHAYKKYDYF